MSSTLFGKNFSKYFPRFSPAQKKIFSISKFFPSFSAPPEQNVNVNISVFFSRPNFPKSKLFSETKFSKTETFFGDQIFQNRHRVFVFKTKCSETETSFPTQQKKSAKQFLTASLTFSQNPGQVGSASGLEASAASWGAGQLRKSYISSVPRWPGSRPPPNSR